MEILRKVGRVIDEWTSPYGLITLFLLTWLVALLWGVITGQGGGKRVPCPWSCPPANMRAP